MLALDMDGEEHPPLLVLPIAAVRVSSSTLASA